MKREKTLAELRAAKQIRLATNEQIADLRAAGSVSPPEVVAFQAELLADGWVYEVPSHEWVSPGEQYRGRLGYQPEFEAGAPIGTETGRYVDIWVHTAEGQVVRSKSGTNPFTGEVLR